MLFGIRCSLSNLVRTSFTTFGLWLCADDTTDFLQMNMTFMTYYELQKHKILKKA